MSLFNLGDIDSLGGLLATLLNLLAIAILVRALMSWFVRDPYNPIVRILDTITEPILQPLRQIMPRMGMMDFTPLVAIILLQVLASFVRNSGL